MPRLPPGFFLGLNTATCRLEEGRNETFLHQVFTIQVHEHVIAALQKIPDK